MMIDEKKHAVEVSSRTHLEMDEIEELLELARKTDPRSWCILTLAFNHGLRVSECAGGAPAIPGKTRIALRGRIWSSQRSPTSLPFYSD